MQQTLKYALLTLTIIAFSNAQAMEQRERQPLLTNGQRSSDNCCASCCMQCCCLPCLIQHEYDLSKAEYQRNVMAIKAATITAANNTTTSRAANDKALPQSLDRGHHPCTWIYCGLCLAFEECACDASQPNEMKLRAMQAKVQFNQEAAKIGFFESHQVFAGAMSMHEYIMPWTIERTAYVCQ